MTTRISSAGFVSLTLTAWSVVAAADTPDHGDELAAPFAVEAAKYIPKSESSPDQPPQDNRYPWFGDFDGDGKPDLLVGDFGHRLRIYYNLGSASVPKFDTPFWFHNLCPTGILSNG